MMAAFTGTEAVRDGLSRASATADVAVAAGQTRDDAARVAVEAAHSDEQRLFVVGDLEHGALRSSYAFDRVALQKMFVGQRLSPDLVVEDTIDTGCLGTDSEGDGDTAFVTRQVGPGR